MKSRFEIENGVDLETLSYDQLLIAARLFAMTAPVLITESLTLADTLKLLASTTNITARTKPKAAAALVASFCVQLDQVASAYHERMCAAAFELGASLSTVGLTSTVNPANTTRQ